MKLMRLLAVVVLVLALVSCETFDELVTSVTNRLGGGGTTVENSASAVSAPATKLPPFALPKSYDVADSYRTDTPWSTAKSMPSAVDSLRKTSPGGYVEKVCSLIEEAARNDFEKAKMAHDVVAILVTYDAANFWAGTVPDQSWASVVSTKLAVCEGYANLYKEFCDRLGIRNEVVKGYARGVGYDVSQGEDPADSNHAWNLVRLEDCWYLVDVTWDSGYMEGRKAVRSYSTEYLFTRPNQFLHTHFPTQKRHQLMETPLDATEFTRLPHLRPRYFAIAQNPGSAITMKNLVEDSFSVEYDDCPDYVLRYVVRNGKGTELKNCSLRTVAGGRVTDTINFPEKGLYTVSVFAFPKGKNSGKGVGEFMVEASVGTTVLFPQVWSSGGSESLVSPLAMPLKKGETYTFTVYAPEKKFVAVINGKQFTQMKKDKEGYFTLEYKVPQNASTITIGTSQTERGSYASFASFSVQ